LRISFVNETNRGAMINTATLNRFTGEKELTARKAFDTDYSILLNNTTFVIFTNWDIPKMDDPAFNNRFQQFFLDGKFWETDEIRVEAEEALENGNASFLKLYEADPGVLDFTHASGEEDEEEKDAFYQAFLLWLVEGAKRFYEMKMKPKYEKMVEEPQVRLKIFEDKSDKLVAWVNKGYEWSKKKFLDFETELTILRRSRGAKAVDDEFGGSAKVKESLLGAFRQCGFSFSYTNGYIDKILNCKKMTQSYSIDEEEVEEAEEVREDPKDSSASEEKTKEKKEKKEIKLEKTEQEKMIDSLQEQLKKQEEDNKKKDEMMERMMAKLEKMETDMKSNKVPPRRASKLK